MFNQSRLFYSFLRRCTNRLEYSIKIDGKPIGDKFFDFKAQFYMKRLIKVDYDDVFRLRKMGKPLSPPTLELMTDEELNNVRKATAKKAHYYLQLPPIIDVSEDVTETLSNDTSLDGHDVHHAKIVFTDISNVQNPHERLIVVREPNGLLRTADKNEKQRMNQIFFPMEGRELYTPKMFEPQHLEKILDRKDYEFILDRACIQFEPDDEEFHRILISTFERINKNNDFDKICKTRHFGSFGFYLVINRKIKNLLQYFMKSKKICKAAYLVKLYDTVHANSQILPHDSADLTIESLKILSDEACIILKEFVSNPVNNVLELEPTLNALIEELSDSKSSEGNILRTHGVE